MNKIRALTATGLIVLVLLSGYLGYYYGKKSTIEQDVPYYHMVTFVIRRHSEVVYNYTIHNILTTPGAKYCRNILGFNNVTAQNATQWITLSDDTTPNKAWTKLPGEFTTGGLERQLASMTPVNDTTYQAYALWTSATSTTVKCTGLQYSGVVGSDGNLWAVASIPDATVIPGDDVEVTWKVHTPDG